MSAEEFNDAAPRARPRRTSWLAWLGATLVLMAAFGYIVVKPAVERVMHGGMVAVGWLMHGIATAMANLYETSCRRVEQSDEVKAMVGEPVVCAPFEECEWLDAGQQQQLEFEFKFTGPEGTGQAHVVAVGGEQGLELESIDVTGPAGDVVRLPEP